MSALKKVQGASALEREGRFGCMTLRGHITSPNFPYDEDPNHGLILLLMGNPSNSSEIPFVSLCMVRRYPVGWRLFCSK